MTKPKSRPRNRRRILADKKPSNPDLVDTAPPEPEVSDPAESMEAQSEPGDESDQCGSGPERDPETGRYRPGHSGNTKGRPKAEPLSRHEVLIKLRDAMAEVMLELLRSPISDLATGDDETVAMGFLKMSLRDAIAKDGPARKRLNEWFLATALKADQTDRKDERSDEVVDLVALAELIMDPRLSVEEAERRATEIYNQRDALIRARKAKIKI